MSLEKDGLVCVEILSLVLSMTYYKLNVCSYEASIATQP